MRFPPSFLNTAAAVRAVDNGGVPFSPPVPPTTAKMAETAPPRAQQRAAPANGGKRGATRKGQGKGKKRGARKAAAPRAKQMRRGPAPLTMNVEAAFEVLGACKRKDVEAVKAVTALLNPLNAKARARVMQAVQTILT